MLVEEDLGGEVLGGAAKGGGELVGSQVGFGEAKVAEGDVACRIEEDVFGFEIARKEINIGSEKKIGRGEHTDRQYYTCGDARGLKLALRYKTLLYPRQTWSPSADAKRARRRS